MCAVRGILGAASIAVLAVAAGGSLYYLYRSRIQKPTTMEETVITQVEGDPETVEERQAEPMVEPVLCETVMELMEEDGGVDCPQEEDQATLIMDEAPEALSLLQVSDLKESEEAEVTLNKELCESVVEILVEDGGIDCPQEEDQATLIMNEAPEALSLLQVSDLTESEEAEVTINTELCESVVEILVEDGGIDCPQEEDQATHIMNGAASLLLGTDPAETKEAEREAECRPEAESKKKQRKRGRRGRSRKLRRLGRLRRRGRLGKRGRRLYK
ncbi:uncharacterized protein LOC125799517 isoform X1 [Astyanax mexicanus]|uniref:uncharacterized protein LOC125799517 isoform X1 n=1 Tax=Astyanax mexicanus TaxID=7994 RepID=UPI0020CB1C7C|nr:uncharacterized protein LOC125799517 isoform X1 [Astyanax mexicanus]